MGFKYEIIKQIDFLEKHRGLENLFILLLLCNYNNDRLFLFKLYCNILLFLCDYTKM